MAIKKKTWIILGVVIGFLVIIVIIGSLILKEEKAEEAEDLTTLYINETYKPVEIRKAPFDLGEVIGQLKKYETIKGISEDEWIKCVKDNQTGYIKESDLKEANYPLHIDMGLFMTTGKEGGLFTVDGKVVNINNNTFNFVEIEMKYSSVDGSVMRTDSEYVCRDDVILPGEVKSFLFYGLEEKPRYFSASASVKGYKKVD